MVKDEQNPRSNSIACEMKPNDNFIYLTLIILISWACESSPEINCNDVLLNVEIDNSQSNLNSECGVSDGKLVINASGSIGSELEYSVDNGFTFQKDSIFEQLKPGEYLFGVKDLNGCESEFKKVIIFSGVVFKPKYYQSLKHIVPWGKILMGLDAMYLVDGQIRTLKYLVKFKRRPRNSNKGYRPGTC